MIVKFGLRCKNLNDYYLHLIDLSIDKVCEAARAHRLSLNNPPKSVDEDLETMNKQFLQQTVKQLSVLYRMVELYLDLCTMLLSIWKHDLE